MNVPLLDLSRQNQPFKSQYEQKFTEVLEKNAFILGPEVEALEKEIAAYVGVKHAIGMSSGTDALIVAMMALDIGPGDEVLCPAFTFFGTAGSIARLGALPVFVDVLPDTFNIDLNDAMNKITERTKAIIPVHLFGQSCDMECLQALAKQFNLAVIEDAAQSLGAKYKEKFVGAMGDFGTYSFYPTKNLGGMGDGGMLVTNDDALADKSIWLRNHGMNPRYYHRYVGGNFRLDGLQAAFLRIKLGALEGYHDQRTINAEFYLNNLVGHSGFYLPVVREQCRSVWNQFTLRVREGKRDELKSFLGEKGIGSEIYYPLSLDEQECFLNMGITGSEAKISRELSKSVLSIPVFPEMTTEERDYVLETLWQFGYPTKG